MALFRNLIATADNMVSAVNGTLNAAVKAGSVLNTVMTEQLDRIADASHASCIQAKADRKADFAKSAKDSQTRYREELLRLAERNKEVEAKTAKMREEYSAAGLDFDAFTAEIESFKDLI